MNGEPQTISLEQRLALVETELERLRAGRRRVLGSRTLVSATFAALALALTLGSASARPSATALTVTAPFRVVGADGSLLMQVDKNGVLYYRGGKVVGSLGSVASTANTAAGPLTITAPLRVVNKTGGLVMQIDDSAGTGGELLVNGPQGWSAKVGMIGSNFGLRLFSNSTLLANLIADQTSGYFSVRDAKGATLVQATGDATGGDVQVSVSGKPRAVLSAKGSDGATLQMLGAGGTVVAEVAQHAQGGYLGLGNPGGTSRVQAGVLAGDAGVVRVYGPAGFNFIQGRTQQ